MREKYKNDYDTKIKLKDAFKEILRHKTLAKITINDITQKANLNRNTFYYHFEDINGLIIWALNEDMKEFKSFINTTNYIEAFSLILDYAEKNKVFLKNIGREHLRAILFDEIYATFKLLIDEDIKEKNITIEEEYKDFLCLYLTNATSITLGDYFMKNKNYSKEKILNYFEVTIRKVMP